MFVAFALATACAESASSQLRSTTGGGEVEAQAGGSPVAFIYVSNSPSANTYEIEAFAADSAGRLTPVAGSPFAADVQSLAVNGQYLFGTNGVDIRSFSVAPDGSLQQAASINAQQFNGYNCGGPVKVFLDRSGATLYDVDFYGNICANNTYQSFGVNGSTGELTYLGASSPSTQFGAPLSFIGNNLYGYGSNCYHFSASVYGFQRNNDGTLTSLAINPPAPVAKPGDFYCTSLSAADRTNHVAIAVRQLDGQSWQPDGLPQLATYTADSSGNLTTRSTYLNMPKQSAGYPNDIEMSPSGRLLAVAGTAGLQVFHFHGSNPITHYTGLLTRNPVDELSWDNRNHLYALSRASGKLFVFTITPTSFKQAPGSPYTIVNPQGATVLPKM
jgi:hypothetical protein